MTTLVEMTNPIIIQANLSVQSTQGEGLQVSSLHSLQLTQIAHRLTWMALCIALTILRFKSSGTNSNRFHLLRYVLHISAYFFFIVVITVVSLLLVVSFQWLCFIVCFKHFQLDNKMVK